MTGVICVRCLYFEEDAFSQRSIIPGAIVLIAPVLILINYYCGDLTAGLGFPEVNACEAGSKSLVFWDFVRNDPHNNSQQGMVKVVKLLAPHSSGFIHIEVL